ncbi:MAG TPA: 3-phosphoserine/phosphohydroxythreonine transaminase [Chitinophagaceae bacterium]|nr:3-phosphoserine/phosphohydroxythreonine transaminase [Chitinophagaceae bacterium]
MNKINFYSGPAALPEAVLQQASEGILNFENQGISIAAISHRSQQFLSILEEFKHLISSLLKLNDEHEILILQGGARNHFAQIPMNFLTKEKKAAFVDTGYWAKKAMEYASYYGAVEMIASGNNNAYQCLPLIPIAPQKEYIHITSNNTIYGTQFHQLPITESPLVVDMSSDIFSIQRDFSKIDLAFACAQKNIGPAGFSVLIFKKEFLQKANQQIPPIFNYQNLAAHASNYSTPPVLNIYIALLNLRWLASIGGVEKIEKINQHKASLLYNEIDKSALFKNTINAKDRSMMNVCFFGKSPKIENDFIVFCQKNNLIGIKGHKQAGGLRASIYNAVTLENVQTLIELIQTFEKEYSF